MNTTLRAVPSTGLFYDPFTVQVVIDGHGDIFNAAHAKVSLSNTVNVQNVIPGSCNFTFTRTPSITDPSFEGVMLGASSKKCSVYSLVLLPVKDGEAMLQISNATVRRYGDAAEVLTSIAPGKYTIQMPSDTPSATSAPEILISPVESLQPTTVSASLSPQAPPQKNNRVAFPYWLVLIEVLWFAFAFCVYGLFLFYRRRKNMFRKKV